MALQEGDFVSGKEFSIGKYLGTEVFDHMGGKTFLKIYDVPNKITHFILPENGDGLRKLPSKKDLLNKLRIFEDKSLLDIDEIEGSRYKYLKEKLEKTNFESELEVLHDLIVLKDDKQSTVGENKLLMFLKEKMMNEMSHILSLPQDEAANLLKIRH